MQQRLKNLRKKQQAMDNLKGKPGGHIAAANAGSEACRGGRVGLIGCLTAQMRRGGHDRHAGGFL